MEHWLAQLTAKRLIITIVTDALKKKIAEMTA